MNKKYHYVYKTTCLINDKFYIGIHSTNEINDNYLGSGKILKLSIRKHGKNNHKKEILEYCDNRKLVFAREKDIVNEKLCMNLVVGGCGCALGWANFNKNTSKEKMFDICSKGGKKGGFVNRHLWSDETKSRCKKISSDILKKAHVDGKMRYDGMLDKNILIKQKNK